MTMELWKALKYLYPAARPFVDYLIRDDSDGRGPYIAEWHLPDPQPDQAALTAASDAYDARQAQQAADAAALRSQVVALAQSAVGVRVDLLTAAQVRALAAVLLWKVGALDKSGIVRPLGEWT